MDVEGMIERLKAAQKVWRRETEQQPMPSEKKYDCPICKDQEILLIDDKAVVCECAAQKRLARVMKSCNISDEIQRKTFDAFGENVEPEILEIKRMCEEYARGLVKYYERKGSLVGAPSLGICGTSGLGKTHLITAIAKVLLDETKALPVFFNWISSFKEWLGYYNSADNKDKVNEIRDKLYHADILIIDDLCKDGGNASWVNEMYGVIDYRYRKQLPIIFSSEYYGELVNLLSEAVFGRLREMTQSAKTGKYYMKTCFVKAGENPLKYNYRLRGM